LTTHVFRYNTVLKAGQSGIQLVDYAGDSKRTFQIYGNLFLNCEGSGVSMMANEHSDENYKGSDMVENVVVYNNTFHGCNHGMTLSPKAIVLNNIFSNCLKGVGRGEYITSDNDKTMLDYCLFFKNATEYDGDITAGTHILKEDPGFKDTKTFELSQGSPAVDAGTAEYADILKIPEGTYKGSAPDLGAKELTRGRSEIRGVSAVRIERLAKGINIPGWFWLNRGPVDELEKRYPDSDFHLMKKLGFTNVRIPIDMANVYDESQPDLLDKANLPHLDRGIRKILSCELAIIIDLHSISQREGGSNYSGPLGQDEGFTDTFCSFWRSFAQHLSQFDPDWVILEPMNEPVLSGREENWPPVQEKVIGAMREGAPEHSILATGARWSNLDTLLELEPLKDRNIIYNFHFYEPHTFTHQGASWSSDWVKTLRDIPYPSSPEAVKDLIRKYTDKRIVNNIRHYGEQRWNAKKIEARMRLASEWAKKHDVKVICDEWGTYKRYCPPEHRTAWVRDVRESCEKYGIGWCMWTFDGSFGVVDRDNKKVVVDEDIAKALGLKVE
jgi:aryl-phospho-beta-D-glucosidase BglC (GH1 family)